MMKNRISNQGQNENDSNKFLEELSCAMETDEPEIALPTAADAIPQSDNIDDIEDAKCKQPS